MGKCPNCGYGGWGFSTTKCKNCGKEICNNCGLYLFKLWDVRTSALIDDEVWYVCSQKCFQDFVSQIERHLSSTDVGISARLGSDKISSLVGGTLLKLDHEEYLGKDFAKIKAKKRPFCVIFSQRYDLGKEPKGNVLYEILEKHVRCMLVKNLITIRNLEAAAKLYEEIGMYEEAGKIRSMDKEIRIKKTEVSVDLNSLLHQLKDGGVVVVYRCPHCGGKLKIDKNASVDKLRICEHCGSQIETIDLAELLKTALS
jgi:DNA-directed RNA polymerase subunit RPC12/RpoP